MVFKRIVFLKTKKEDMMNGYTEVLQNVRRIIKYYEKTIKNIGDNHGLTQIEINILSFLHYHPSRNTASDIVELRMLPKGNVSQAVEKLIQKGLLQRKDDAEDRRKVRLFLMEKTRKIVDEIDRNRRAFEKQIFKGFTETEKKEYSLFAERIFTNVAEGMKKSSGEDQEI